MDSRLPFVADWPESIIVRNHNGVDVATYQDGKLTIAEGFTAEDALVLVIKHSMEMSEIRYRRDMEMLAALKEADRG